MDTQQQVPQSHNLSSSDVEFEDEQPQQKPRVTPQAPKALSSADVEFEDQPAPAQATPPAPVVPKIQAAPQSPKPIYSEAQKAELAKYPENQAPPDPAYVLRRKQAEQLAGLGPDSPEFTPDPEQERRIAAQEEVERGKSENQPFEMNMNVSPIPGHLPKKTVPVIGTGLKAIQENVNEPRAKLTAAGAKLGGDIAEGSVMQPDPYDIYADRTIAGQEKRLQEFRKESPAIAGTVRAAGSVAGGMVADPAMWPFFFAGPEVSPALRMATGAGFAGQMATGAVEQASDLGKVMDDPNVPQDQKWEMGASAVLSALMAGHGGAHLMMGAFQKLSPGDQAQIRARIRQKAPELAKQMDDINAQGGAGAAPPGGPPPPGAPPGAPGNPPTNLTSAQVELEKPEKFRLPKRQTIAEVPGPVKGPNLRNVEVDGKTYAYDVRKINEDGVRRAVGRGEAYKLTGEKAPPEAQAQAQADVKGEEAPPPTELKADQVEEEPTPAKPGTDAIIQQAGMVNKGEVSPGTGVYQIEHPDHPGKTTTMKADEIADPEAVRQKVQRHIEKSTNAPSVEDIKNRYQSGHTSTEQGSLEEMSRGKTLKVNPRTGKTGATMGNVDIGDGEAVIRQKPGGELEVLNNRTGLYDREVLARFKSNTDEVFGKPKPSEAGIPPGMTTDSPAVERVEQQADLAPGQEPQVIVKKEPAEIQEKLAKEPEPVAAEDMKRIGKEDPESGRPIVQPTDSPLENQRLAAEAAPDLAESLSKVAAAVPGAKFERLRPQKTFERVGEKIEEEGKPAETVKDYLAAQVAADTVEAKDKLIREIHHEFPGQVLDVEDNFLKGKKDLANYRAVYLQVQMPNGESAEIQIVPREIYDINLDTHKFYQAGREAENAGNKAEAKRNYDKAAEMHDAAMEKFNERTGAHEGAGKEAQGAIREPGGTRVFSRAQEGTGEAGSERGRVGRGEQGQAQPSEAQPSERGPAVTRETEATKEEGRGAVDLAKKAAGGDEDALRALVRERLAKKEETKPAQKPEVIWRTHEIIPTRSGVVARERFDFKDRSVDSLRAELARMRGSEKTHADVQKNEERRDAIMQELDQRHAGEGKLQTKTSPEPERKFSLKPPPEDIGVKQYIGTLPREQQEYARKAWEAIKEKGADGLHEVYPNEFGLDPDDVENVDRKLLGISKQNEPAGGAAASERANIRRGLIPGEEPKPKFTTKKPAEKVETAYGSKNTVFTADKRDAAIDRLKAKMGRLNVGVDPEILKDLIDIGGYHFEAGLREFADWSKKITEDVGDWAKPYLSVIHDEIRNIIEQEKGNEAAQPGRGEETRPVSGPTGEGRHPSERPQAEGVQGTEGQREAAGRTGSENAAGVEQPARLPGERPANGRGERVESGADTAEGRGQRGAGTKGTRGKRPVGADGKPVAHDSPSPPAEAQVEAHDREQSKNFKYAKPEEVGSGGEMAKIDANLDAIELLKKLDKEQRHATPEEQEVLAKYTGWGGLSGIFNNRYSGGYSHRYERLQDLVSGSEFNAITKSTLNAHYTSPEVVQWMWKLAGKMGFKGGRIIEPGMGAGYFFGLMPDEVRKNPDTKLLGVELDPTTGRIAQELYQGAKIINAGYETVQMPDNSLDFAIGNVPFLNVVPADPRYRKMKLSLHDYYFVKTLDKVRPGGMVMFITSRYTMDKMDPKVRSLMADRADLVAAYRLPNTAFKGVANTEVIADLLVLRKRFADEVRAGEPFENAVKHADSPGTDNYGKAIADMYVNQYFHDNPEKMFGTMEYTGKMYRKGEPTLEPKGELAEHLDRALEGAPKDVYSHEARGPEIPEFADPTQRAPDSVKDGAFYLDDKNTLKVKRQGIPIEPPPEFQGETGGAPALRSRLRDAIGLRDKTSKLLAQMLASGEDEGLKPLQADLNKAYDAYVKKHGLLHGKKTLEAYGKDPDYGVLLSLENWDPKEKTGAKADIFSKRTMRPYERPLAISDEPHSWLPASLASLGKLDTGYLAELTGKPKAEIEKTLVDKGLAFKDPDTGNYQTADEYLSGEVRDKLTTARRAAELNPAFKQNVEALEKSQPEKVPIHQVSANLGMHWIPGDVYADFIHDMAKTSPAMRGGRQDRYRLEVGQMPSGEWALSAGQNFNSIALDKEFGAGGKSGLAILEDSLNGRRTNVYYRDESGIHLDKEKTLAARESQSRLKAAFNKWLRDKTEHHEKLEGLYNEVFNGTRQREFDGSHLTFPGLNPSWTMRPHQSNAIWRIIQNGRALLAHEVGAGKTLEMIGAGMELRRLGMSKKNMYVVPNNMVGQWNGDFGRTYPGGRVLAAPEKGFSGPTERNEFMAKAATGDWDAVIVPHSVFDLLPISPEVETKYVTKQLADLRESLKAVEETMQDGKQKKRTIKDIERQLEKKENRLKDIAGGKRDKGLPFDQLGADMLFVDEAHLYKNLPTNSRLGSIQGLPSGRSARSENMEMKTQHMLDTHNGRGVVFATGTPIANSIAETYNMSRFVAPDILEKAGLRNFDDWRASFADVQTNWEYKADGMTYKPVDSISQYVNVPEASSMFRQFADVKTAADLNLPVPKPKRIDHVLTVTDVQEPLLKHIAERAKALEGGKVDPKIDGWLKLSSDARKISLDPRLFDESLPDHPEGKIHKVVESVKDIWERLKADKATQIIYSDFAQSHERIPLGRDQDGNMKYKPGKVLFDTLAEIKRLLVKEGIPAREIAIAAEYSKSEMKQLQDDMRAGKVRIAMGSTEKLGVGLNVQDRLYAEHHLDQPWRPADVTQREGRELRQGNGFHDTGKAGGGDDVEIHRYVSEPKTIDSPRAYDLQMFQKLERKKRMIDSFLDGSLKARTIEDVSGRAMLTPQDFAIGKAAAAGNPDALKKVQLEQEIQRLNILHRDWRSKRWNAEGDKRVQESRGQQYQAQIAAYEMTHAGFEKWEKQPEAERAAAVIDGKEFRSMKDSPASTQIREYLDKRYETPSDLVGERTFHIAGVDVPVRLGGEGQDLYPEYKLAGERFRMEPDGWKGSTLYNSVMARLHSVPNKIADLKAKLTDAQEKVKSYEAEAGGESPFEKKLEAAELQLMETNKRLGIGVDKPPEEFGAASEVPPEKEPEPEPEEDLTDEEEPPDRGGERGAATPSAMPIPALIESTLGVIDKGAKLYHGAVDKLLEKVHMGQTRPEIRQFDPDAADLATKMDASGAYHKAVAEQIAKAVTGPLAENFLKTDTPDQRAQKNEISRDRMKGFHFMADEQNREFAKEHYPDDYKRWAADPKIADAIKAYKPFEEDLRDAVKQLGGKTIDEDYIKRIMDFTTSGVAREIPLPPGVEGPRELKEGRQFTRGGGRDSVVSPQVDRSKARKDEGQYYWDHGVFDFGPSFEKRWVEVMSKLDEHRLAVHSMSMGTRIAPDEEAPEKIFYNGQEFYRPDTAKEIREVLKRGVSSESKALADALGVSELPAPSRVRQYDYYEPLRRGSRFETAARNLAANVLAGKEGLEGQAANIGRMVKLRYAVPEEIVKALHDAGREKEQGALSKKVSQVLGPVTQFIRQQIVGLAYGVPHMANIMRKVIQVHRGATLNPMAYVDAFKVAFSKELKQQAVDKGPSYMRLLRDAAISEGAIPEYKHYIEGNLNLKNWEGLKESAQTAKNAFRRGGKAGADITPGSALAGAGRLLMEPLNRFSEAGHRNLFKEGGIDQRARIWMEGFLKDRYPQMKQEAVAHEVNQTLGRYNRASWTDVQRGLAPFMLFPGWDYSSITYALKHPFKTAVAPAIVMMLANAAVRGLGGQQRKDEKYDLGGIHVGKFRIRANLLNDNMGSHMWGWALRGAQAGIERKGARAGLGDVVRGIPGDVAGVSTGTLNPLLSGTAELSFGKMRPGAGSDIAKSGDYNKPGRFLPNKAAEDYTDFAARKFFPLYDQATQEGGRPSISSAARLAGVSVIPRKKKR